RGWSLTITVFGMMSLTANSMIHDLTITNDNRREFKIESFGFSEGGVMNLTLSDFMVKGSAEEPRMGFIVKKTSTESSAQQELEGNLDSNICMLDMVEPGDLVMNPRDPNNENNVYRKVGPGQKGLYVLLFCQCPPLDREGMESKKGHKGIVGGVGSSAGPVPPPLSPPASVSFHLRVVFFNEGLGGAPDFLSTGNGELPTLFFCFFVLFLATLLAWVHCLRKNRSQV
ncbi:unnamed protein product, partial [Choristocarpus tenellus]